MHVSEAIKLIEQVATGTHPEGYTMISPEHALIVVEKMLELMTDCQFVMEREYRRNAANGKPNHRDFVQVLNRLQDVTGKRNTHFDIINLEPRQV